MRGWLATGFVGIFACVGVGSIIVHPTEPFGWCWMVTLAVVLALIFGASGRHAKLRAEGIAATAYVIEASETGVQINDRPVMRVKWRIHPPDKEPFETECRETVPIAALGRLSLGAPFSIHLDPKDYTNFDVDWSIGPVPPRTGTPSADDVAQRIKRIDDLRISGVITEAEYQQQRSRILGDL